MNASRVNSLFALQERKEMKPIITDTTNGIAQGDGCEELPLTKTADGTHYETCWQLNEEELKKVQETGKIYVCIRCSAILPMCVDVETMLMTEGDANGSEQ